MKKLVIVALTVAAAQLSFARGSVETKVCSTAESCAGIVLAKSVKALNAGKGLAGCGVIYGETVVEYSDIDGNVLGYACEMKSTGGN